MPFDGSCSSCGRRLVMRGATLFLCPDCGDADIGRCPECRDQSVRYKCRGCGFTGP